MVAPPGSDQCQRDLSLLLQECARLGVPTVAHKTEGPSSCLVFLGIVVDTLRGKLSLPEDKLRRRRLQSLLLEWVTKKVCTRK